MEKLPRFKLFPRNLTARASIMVTGNSVDTRPESGVENCFPGLEFDQRNMDKRFFAGLTFELHHDDGVILRSIAADSPAAAVYSEADLVEGGVYLAYLDGLFSSRSSTEPARRTVSMLPPAGLESWRLIRDLGRGPVGILLVDAVALNLINRGLAVDPADLFAEEGDTLIDFGQGRALRLFGTRATYLDAQGVIAATIAAPGELTQSLCSPWQYDFADCGCFYWAANKPDLVSSEHQPEQVLNFQRQDRSPEADQSAKSADWLTMQGGAWDSRAFTMGHVETMQRWQDLPFVIGRRETASYRHSAMQPPAKTLSRAEIVARLKKLAAVEHALAVEYLYAHYSFGLPHSRPGGLAGPQARIYNASQELFQVAIDEMRHLRAVNDILVELGESAVLDRAQIIGEDFDGPGTGFNHAFALRPCDPDQLAWFIAVEQASQNSDDQATIDGMYTLILKNVVQGNEFSEAEKHRIAASVKVIIDEGVDHHQRFVSAQTLLSGIAPTVYLRIPDGPPQLMPEGSSGRALQDVVDAAYLVVLRALDFVFKLGDKQRGALMEAARRAMYNMDDAARSLAVEGVGALFDYSRFGDLDVGDNAAGLAISSAESRLEQMGDPLLAALARLKANNPASIGLAGRMEDRLAAMKSEFAAALKAQ